MIRKTIKDDVCKIKELLKKEVGEFNEEELEEKLKDNSSSLVYENDGEIVGFAVISIYNKELKRAQMMLYVSESYRKKGIGKELYLKSLNYFDKSEFEHVFIDIRTEKNNTGEFFTNRGFEKGYGYTRMEYTGGRVESDLQLVNYENEYYENYKNAYEDCFLQLRQALGFKPERDCYKPEELINNKHKIFLLLDNKEIIGSVSFPDGEIDDFFVNQKYQRQGYGRNIINFAINHYQKLGVEKIFLDVADWNVNAVRLYESSGFNGVRKYEVYRINLKNR